MWGSNGCGQLGVGDVVRERLSPTLLRTPHNVKFVSVVAGGTHSMALAGLSLPVLHGVG